VKAARPDDIDGPALILNGDHPLIDAADMRRILEDYKNGPQGVSVITAVVQRPKNYGRIVRLNGALRAIVEAKDASADTLKTREINNGIYLVNSDILKTVLPRITDKNAQKEFYLTDMVQLAIDAKIPVTAFKANS